MTGAEILETERRLDRIEADVRAIKAQVREVVTLVNTYAAAVAQVEAEVREQAVSRSARTVHS